MAVSHKKKVVFGAGGVVVLLIAALFINGFVYPFVSAKPNYADVEVVFNKLQVPSDWKLTATGSNKGIAGRRCPIESDGCFSKASTFIVPKSTTVETIKDVMKKTGCISVTASKSEERGGPTSTTFICSSGPVILTGSLLEKEAGWDLYLNAKSN